MIHFGHLTAYDLKLPFIQALENLGGKVLAQCEKENGRLFRPGQVVCGNFFPCLLCGHMLYLFS